MIRPNTSWITVGRLALSAFTLVSATGSVFAQATTPQSGKPAQPAAQPAPQVGAGQTPKKDSQTRTSVRVMDDASLPLNAGDVIQIVADNYPMLDTIQTIPGVGKLLLPEVGEIEIAGKTVKQVQDKLQAAIDKNFNNITVHVLLKEMHSRKVSVSGFLLHPGSLDMGTSEYRFLDIIDFAGGLVAPVSRPYPKPGEYRVVLYRQSEVLVLDLEDIVKHPESPKNLVIQPGDRLSFELMPVAIHQIHILGQIPREGAYPIDSFTTVLSLFGMSGYPNTASALSKAYVIRGNDKIPFDLRPLLTGSVDTSVNKFKFADEDIIYIPESKLTFMVWGQVGRQGNFPFPEAGKVSLLEALNVAGQIPAGDYKKVHVIRTVDGKQKDTLVNVDEMVRKGKMADNVPLQPNDIVWIGPKSKKKWFPTFQELFMPISLMNMLGLRPF